ncbi:MAG: hypothetical protein WC856_06180 [Methylococcaceae bacterium]|jgi:hypothetical protein
MRNYLVHLCLATFVFLSLAVGFNWLIDSYRIFSKSDDKEYFESNTRFQKTNYITENCQAYNSMIFGNSRAAVFPPEAVNGEKNRFFNFSVSEEKVNGIFLKASYLVSLGCLKNIAIIPVSLDTIGTQDWDAQKNLLRSESPLLSKRSYFDFFSSYLLNFEITHTNFNYVIADASIPRFIYAKDGAVSYTWEMGKEDFEKCNTPVNFDKVDYTGSISQDLEIHKKLASLFKSAGVVPVLILMPLPSEIFTSYQANKQIAGYLKSLEQIYNKKIIANYDKEFTNDYKFWHDCGHFKKSVFENYLAPAIRASLVNNEKLL